MKRIELIATVILTVLASGIYSSRAQDAPLIAQQAYIKASNTGANDWFGTAVAISGDTLVITAPFESTGINGNQTNNSVFTGLGPPAPQLAIERSADNVRILWPLSAANFVLEQTDDLNASLMMVKRRCGGHLPQYDPQRLRADSL